MITKDDVLLWLKRKYGNIRPEYLAQSITTVDYLLELAFKTEKDSNSLQEFVKDLQSYAIYENILTLSDEHKKESDPRSIKGYRNAMRAIHKDKLDLIDKYRITQLHHLGDIYDRGYESKSMFYNDTTHDRELSDKVDGHYYEVGGNHTNRDVDRNAELYLIQPCDRYPTKDKLDVTTPVIKVVDKLKIGKTQFNFFHWNKFDKEYWAPRDTDTITNIGYYHDESVLPSCINMGFAGKTTVTSDYLNKVFYNIDIAVIGHWHLSYDPFTIYLSNGRPVTIIIPGSIGITSVKKEERHSQVNLPLFKVRGDKVDLEYVPISTHLELLEFKEEKFKEKKEAKGKILSYESESGKSATGNMIKFDNIIQNHRTLEERLIREVDQFAPDYYRAAVKGELSFNKAVLLSHGRRE